MRVVLGATCLRPTGAGTSTYVRELLKALPPERPEITAVVQRDAVEMLPVGIDAKTVPVRSGARRAALNAITRPRGELFHGLDVDLPIRSRGPAVATFHDLSVYDVPWAWPRLRARGEQLLLRHAARRADVIVAVSPFTAERIKSRFGRDSVAIPIAPAPDLVPPTDDAISAAKVLRQLPDTFILHVGTIEPRKNVERLAAACAEVGAPLVLAGDDWERSRSLPGEVHRLGFVHRAELPALYAAATATAYVSVYEGFGLPPVEAMACGAAVVCSPVASLRPLLGDDAAEWVRPTDVADIARGLRLVIHDAARRAELSVAGRSAVSVLSWEDTACRTVDIWRSLI
ncbi:MAG TPA: glycosyltransferase family 1 protein [Mycobacteriales bacterium]|nr:glycosyltransferase family 1 protein [Mycobacteriales bacterium]